MGHASVKGPRCRSASKSQNCPDSQEVSATFAGCHTHSRSVRNEWVSSQSGYRRFDFLAATLFRVAFAFFCFGLGFGVELTRVVPAFEASMSDSS